MQAEPIGAFLDGLAGEVQWVRGRRVWPTAWGLKRICAIRTGDTQFEFDPSVVRLEVRMVIGQSSPTPSVLRVAKSVSCKRGDMAT
jgi:hypothetical protein